MLRFTAMESVLSPSMPTWMQQTTPLFRLWYASAYVVVACFGVLSVLAQGLSLSLCLLLLDSDYFWVNDNPFQRCALIIMLEEDELSRVACVVGFSSISNAIPHEKTVSYYWSIAWIGTKATPGPTPKRFFAAYWSSMLTLTCYTFQKCWHLAPLWTSVVNYWQRYLNCNLIWSFARTWFCMKKLCSVMPG